MTVCAAGGLPIPDQPWQVESDNGRVSMCEVHSMAVDLGRALDESVGLDPAAVEQAQEVLAGLLAMPCPQPRPVEAEPTPQVDLGPVPPLETFPLMPPPGIGG